MLDSLRQDVVYALRRLRQAPGFSLIATLTLALGIGANSAIFTVVNAVLLRPLPFHEPERLVQVAQTWEGRPVVHSPQNFLDVEAQARSFQGMAAIDSSGFTLTGRGAASRLEGAEVSASFFEVLRSRPSLGRGFVAGENEPGRTQVVVLGHRLWRDRFGGDPAVVGRTVHLNREPYVVVGVARAGFRYPEGGELWTPIEYDEVFRTRSRGAWYLTVIGRLAEGVSLDVARDEVATIAARLANAYPADNEGVGGTVLSLHEALVGDARRALFVLLGAVVLVLLVACVNVANLFMTRIAARENELALRTALGAGRGRLLRQLIIESILLAALGGRGRRRSCGPAGRRPPRALSRRRATPRRGTGRPRRHGLRRPPLPDHEPAVRSIARISGDPTGDRTVAPSGQPDRGGRGPGRAAERADRRTGGLGHGAARGIGTHLRSFARLRAVDPGFSSDSALTFRVSLPESAYADDTRLLGFYEELHRRLAALPGVRSVAAVLGLPLTGRYFNIGFTVEGRPEPPPAQQPTMEVRVATPGYFHTMGILVRRGRTFEPGDGPEAPQVVVLSETAVRRFFPAEDPLGKRIKLGLGRGRGRKAGGEVVGVVADVKDLGLASEHAPVIYVPYAQFPMQSMDLVLRTHVEPHSLAAAVERVVRGLDPELPVARVLTLEEVVARSVSEPRFYTVLLGSFAGTALFLAALGLFGVVSYAVGQRTRELAVRLALGARREAVLRVVLRDAVVLAMIGIAIGLAGAVALSRTIEAMLFSLSPTDPVTLGSVALLLLGTALPAGCLPARRATAIDPVIVLRSE